MANDFRGYLYGLGQQGDINASNALNYVGGDYTGNGTTGVNTSALGEYFQAAPGDSNPDSYYQDQGLQSLQNYYKQYANGGGQVLGDSTSRTSATGGTADDVSFLNDQESQLRGLLGRTDTGLAQGLTKLGDDYDTSVGQQNTSRQQALNDYGDQRVNTNKGKLAAYDTINRNAGTGYNSLAQIIGRSAGRGSSAFQDLLPNAVGKDASSRRLQATNTAGQNLQNIDKAQNKTELSFSNVLADLLKQKKQGEEDLRTGIEGQRQNINNQLSTVAGQRAQAQGGGYAQVKAAQAPFQSAINGSRDSVENFFNQFRTAYTPQQATIATPDLAQYQVDRAGVNATNQGQDANNPYAALLRKKLQGGV